MRENPINNTSNIPAESANPGAEGFSFADSSPKLPSGQRVEISQQEYAGYLHSAIEMLHERLLPQYSYEGRVGREAEGHLLAAEDGSFCLSHSAREAILALGEESIKPELGSAQFEFNFPVARLEGKVLSEWLAFEKANLARLEQQVAPARAVQIAVPPTLQPSDLTRASLALGQRWDLLEQAWKDAFLAQTERLGVEPSFRGYTPESIAISTAMSSSQLHVELPADEREAARVYNACLLASGPVMAVGAAAPLFLGEQSGMADIRSTLWEELDDLGRGRVFLESDWISTPVEVLERYVQIPRLDLDNQGLKAPLEELSRHIGSIWPHLRLIVAEDHWRVENRLFSSEVPVDAQATAAFYFGLVKSIASEPELAGFESTFAFSRARENLQNATRSGINANITWPDSDLSGKELYLEKLIPAARRGLLASGVALEDIENFMGIIEQRVVLGRNSAAWLVAAADMAQGDSPQQRMAEVARRYVQGQQSGLPVCYWPEWDELAG